MSFIHPLPPQPSTTNTITSTLVLADLSIDFTALSVTFYLDFKDDNGNTRLRKGYSVQQDLTATDINNSANAMPNVDQSMLDALFNDSGIQTFGLIGEITNYVTNNIDSFTL